ncbi:multicopper oxidase domain-containing protein [Herbiconiux sp. CPCC 205763]|uniref:Multicopper oxidase domain-containing protein n=1 Tax=Herbiconiux aconitum TaxID=2970913 RepID=A0ABT2GUR4_9MICO|nr:multicopper oxidase domain-containing protein [Herbiconiux aconitum]MCS5719949.1 multicopper oxidase domain-containing protein [Herbiconiux aconitum]
MVRTSPRIGPRTRVRRPRATLAAAGVLLAGGAVLAIGLGGCGALGGIVPGLLDGGRVDTVGAVEFDRALAVPPLDEGRLDASGTRVFDLTAQTGTTEFQSGAQTPTWGFNSSYLGPTLVADRGEKVRVDVRNELPEATTVHWHGMHLPAAMDGGPHQPIAPDTTWSPTWTIDQPAATLWYHPHPHGRTEAHVARGLAGLFLVRDPEEAALALPRNYGVDDIPLIVQDKRFTSDGAFDDGTRGFVGALGDTLLVNGTLGPYLDVTSEAVRLRLLNASTARTYDFEFADDRTVQLIASDGGLLDAPVPATRIRLSPGERAEIVVRFVPGETTTLRSTPPDLGTEPEVASRNGGADRFDVLQLRAAASLTPAASAPDAPARLTTIERLRESDVTARRTITLDGFAIDDDVMQMDRIDQVVELGATELWTVRNEMQLPHNFHVHDVQFQVLSVGGAPPPPELGGWKDTVYLPPDTEVRLIMRFDDYADPDAPYMYHCHLLWHEDQGMMGQFVVVEPGQGAGTIEGTGHDHH